jgi:hypothetical protein
MAKTTNLEPVEYNTLKRVAGIVGGGAEKCIEAYDYLKKQGKEPSLWLDRKRNTWIVIHDKPFNLATTT